MMFIFGLMLLLLQTAECLEFNCRFNQADPCYAALGHTLNLSMVDAASTYDLKILKRINNNTDYLICRVKSDRKMANQCGLFDNRSEVKVINGTLIINPVIRADSGNYTLELDGSGGTVTYTHLQVNVEAPIGSVEVSISCSSNGVKSVSCSSDGDQLIYSWTLNGIPLKDGNTNIELNETTDGEISCSVKNHVSREQKNISVEYCPGSTTAAVTSTLSSSTPKAKHGTSFSSAGMNLPLTTSSGKISSWIFSSLGHVSLIALGCVTLILILLFITACHFYKRKQPKSTPAPAGETELVYAQISHEKQSEKNKSESVPAVDVEYAAVRPQTKKTKERKEEEVQYGEVTFTPNNSNAHQEPKDECLYSQVQRR